MDAPWTKTPEQVLQHYCVDPARGLSTDQAAKHAKLYGKNGEPRRCITSPPPVFSKSDRVARGTPHTSLGAYIGTVQGPTCPYSIGVGCNFVHPRSSRRLRDVFLGCCFCGTHRHSSHPCRKRHRWRHPGIQCGKRD